MLRSMTEFVFTPHWNQDVRSIPQRCGKLTGASAGRTLMPCGEVRVLVGAEQLVAADAEGVVPAVAVLGAERLRLDDELHRAEAVQLVHQERPVGNRHPQAGEDAPEGTGLPGVERLVRDCRHRRPRSPCWTTG